MTTKQQVIDCIKSAGLESDKFTIQFWMGQFYVALKSGSELPETFDKLRTELFVNNITFSTRKTKNWNKQVIVTDAEKPERKQHNEVMPLNSIKEHAQEIAKRAEQLKMTMPRQVAFYKFNGIRYTGLAMVKKAVSLGFDSDNLLSHNETDAPSAASFMRRVADVMGCDFKFEGYKEVAA